VRCEATTEEELERLKAVAAEAVDNATAEAAAEAAAEAVDEPEGRPL
jgi:hypothetical protein